MHVQLRCGSAFRRLRFALNVRKVVTFVPINLF